MRITDALMGVQRLYIDTAPFIYYVEDHPRYGEKMEFVFDTIATAAIQIVTSVITLTETLAKPLHAGDEVVARANMQLFEDTQAVVLAPVTKEIAERAALWRLQANLRTPDAIHLATAIETECDAVLTNNKSFPHMSRPRMYWLDELELYIPPLEN